VQRDAPVSFADFVLLHARLRPEKPAVIAPDRLVTYAMLAEGMRRAQVRIARLRLAPDEPVCIAVSSPIRSLILAAALFRLGHPIVFANTPPLLVSLGLPVRTFLQDPGASLVPGMCQAIAGEDWFGSEIAGGDGAPATGFASTDSICCIEITSGSTGRPKAIASTLHAHNQHVIWPSVTINGGSWERLLCLAGLNGPWGFRLAAHVLRGGRTLVSAESAREALQMISVYQPDAMAASVQQLRDMIGEQKISPIACPSLRTIFTGGALVTRSLLAEAKAHLCNQIVVQYASTETGAVAIGTADNLLKIEGATGYVLPGAEVEIVDDDHCPLAVGASGIVRMRTG